MKGEGEQRDKSEKKDLSSSIMGGEDRGEKEVWPSYRERHRYMPTHSKQNLIAHSDERPHNGELFNDTLPQY